MQAAEIKAQQFGFVQQLARDLAANDISLPSFPTVVLKIQKVLEDENSNFTQVGEAVSSDPVLVSKLFVFANSSLHNLSGEPVTSLERAISNVGLELVRSTVLSLAVKQLMFAEENKSIVADVKAIWTSSVQLAAMSYSVATHIADISEESAFLCGLLHQIGKLYILTRAKDFPDFLGDAVSLDEVQADWHSQVGRAIVEAWEFPTDVVQSMDPGEFFIEHTHLDPALVDIVYAATSLLSEDESAWPDQMSQAVWRKLGLDNTNLAKLADCYKQKLEIVQLSLA